MSDIPSFRYELLWEEKIIRSVANLTRKDGHDFLALAAQIPVKTDTRLFPFQEANEALAALRKGRYTGRRYWSCKIFRYEYASTIAYVTGGKVHQRGMS